MRALAIVAAALAGACGVPSRGPTMDPGKDCLQCHRGGGGAPSFTAAGTVFVNPGDDTGAGVEGARVHLSDASGRTIALKTNAAGNFYTREKLAFPLRVEVEKDGVRAAMSAAAPHGACNACHTVPPPLSELPARPPGRVALRFGVGAGGDEFMLPGFDCQSCHRPGGAAVAVWNSSGTVFESASGDVGAEGVTVTIVDAQGRTFERVTNRVGNFHMPDGIAFGPSARVRISRGGITREMNDPLTHGSCNGCHQEGGEAGVRVALIGGAANDEFMLPGSDCQSCHRLGGEAGTSPWSSSGTVFQSPLGGAGAEGVTVTITDTQGRTFERVTNSAGNFFIPEGISFGETARVRISGGGVTVEMDEPLTTGSCNACHTPDGEGRLSLTTGDQGD